jgi:BarA-like signal transduction histidine kinase
MGRAAKRNLTSKDKPEDMKKKLDRPCETAERVICLLPYRSQGVAQSGFQPRPGNCVSQTAAVSRYTPTLRMPEVGKNRTETKPVVQKNMGGVWLGPRRSMIGCLGASSVCFRRDLR